LQHRKTTIVINVLALLVTIPMLMNTGSEFMPPLDEGSLLFMPVTLPNASITEVNRILRTQDKIIKSIPEVAHVLGKAGRAETATDNAPLSMIETIILLKPKSQWRKGITKDDIVQELDTKLQIPGVRNGWTQPIINRINMLSTGIRTELGLKIFGPDIDSLETYAIRAEELLKTVPGAADVVAERVQNGYYIDISLKPEAAARYSIKSKDLQDIIEVAIGGQNISTAIEGRMRFPIRVRYARELRDNIEDLKNLIIPLPSVGGNSAAAITVAPVFPGPSANASSGMGGMGMNAEAKRPFSASPVQSASLLDQSDDSGISYLPMSEIADVKVSSGPPMISSENGMIRSVVFLNARGRDMGSVVEDAQKVIQAGLHLPKNYTERPI
jgi:Cu(I)/Ag(I) efflux system membrane protein CusA/SilA